MNNPKYDLTKANHPEWSDEQVWTAISLDMETDRVIEIKGSDVTPDDPTIIKEIINGAKKWLSDVLPQVFERVKSFFDNLINTIGAWVKKGLEYVVDLIDQMFSTNGTLRI